jgi:hypothetical protein
MLHLVDDLDWNRAAIRHISEEFRDFVNGIRAAVGEKKNGWFRGIGLRVQKQFSVFSFSSQCVLLHKFS